jgi:hypothetical protein
MFAMRGISFQSGGTDVRGVLSIWNPAAPLCLPVVAVRMSGAAGLKTESHPRSTRGGKGVWLGLYFRLIFSLGNCGK